MAQFTVNAQRFDPYKNFKFRVKWDGKYVAGVSKVSALKRSSDVIEYKEGGRNLVVSRRALLEERGDALARVATGERGRESGLLGGDAGTRRMTAAPMVTPGSPGVGGTHRCRRALRCWDLANHAWSKCSSSRMLPTAFSATPPVSTSRLNTH